MTCLEMSCDEKNTTKVPAFVQWVRLALLVACTGFAPLSLGAAAVLVDVMPVTVGPLQDNKEYVGTFVSPQRSSISTQIAGRIEKVLVDVGSTVKAGDAVVKLNTELAELEVQRAAALVTQRQAEVREAERLVEDGERLHARQILPESELKARQAARDIAAAALENAVANHAVATKLESQHTVTAPFNGAVVSKDSEAGEWVVPGTGLLRIVRLDELWLDVQIPQSRWPKLQDLVSAYIEVDAIPGERLMVKKIASVPSSRADTRTFLTRFALAQPDRRLTPGMSARVQVSFDVGDSVLAVPRDALIRRADNSVIVWVVVPDGESRVVEERLITTGSATSESVAVLSGLAAGDIVVVRGNENLRSGQTVAVSKG